MFFFYPNQRNLKKLKYIANCMIIDMIKNNLQNLKINEQLQNFITMLNSIDLNLPEDKQVSDIRAFNIRVAPNNNGGMINVIFK